MTEGQTFENHVKKAVERALESYHQINHKQKISQIFSSQLVQGFFYVNSFVIVFRKSTAVTNLQYAELLSLLPETLSSPGREQSLPIMHSARELREDLETLWASSVCHLPSFQQYCSLVNRTNSQMAPKSAEQKQAIKLARNDLITQISEIYTSSYKDQFENTVLLEPFSCSCCLGLPPFFILNLPKLVSQSGYIHSAGFAALVRNFTKADPQELINKLEEFHSVLVAHYKKKNPTAKFSQIKFCVYSHESFDLHESQMEKLSLKDGMDRLKIFANKSFIGTLSIADLPIYIPRALGTDKYHVLADTLHHTDAISRYREKYAGKDEIPSTVFLFRDNSIGLEGMPGRESFYICYAQTVMNGNPFQLFEEDKLGWLGPVTTPHSLASSMINIARRGLSKTNASPVTFWDPFCSSGTIPLEISRFDHPSKVIASDVMDVVNNAIADNLDIFCSTVDKRWDDIESRRVDLDRGEEKFTLTVLISTLKGFLDQDLSKYSSHKAYNLPIGPGAPALEIMDWIWEKIHTRLRQFLTEDPSTSLENGSQRFSEIQELRQFTPFQEHYFQIFFSGEMRDYYWLHRFILYSIWKCACNNIDEFLDASGKQKIFALFREEIKWCLERLGKLMSIRARSASAVDPKYLDISDADKIVEYRGEFSAAVSLDVTKIRPWWDVDVTLIAGERGNLSRVGENYENYFDIIVTDPPYGFNVPAAGASSQLLFYREFVKTSLKAIKPGGQVIFCLPDQSHNGQAVPWYLRRPWVLREFFLQMSRMYGQRGRIILVSTTKPRHGGLLFAPPYYWRSTKALTRSVLHLTIEKPEFERRP
jgi:tRNA G10  N-methylase Trm11